MRSGIIAAGNWLIDHVKLIDQWPPQDGLAHILGRTAGNGGGPYNVLKDLAKLRAAFPLEAIGLTGDDADIHPLRTEQLLQLVGGVMGGRGSRSARPRPDRRIPWPSLWRA